MKIICLIFFKVLFVSLFILGVIYFARPNFLAAASLDIDSDGDGYADDLEINSGYSPFTAEVVKLTDSDVDQDGLSDYWELKFKTDALNPDTDGDSYQDGLEIDQAFDPLSSSTRRLDRHLEIDLRTQKLFYFLAGQRFKEFIVSTGRKSMPTPTGNFKIINKNQKAWSKTYQLWMPYWLGLGNGSFGIHELPIWPGGGREGADHLGTPVSHGCIRLGVGSAEYLFKRVDIGTGVIIK